MGKRLQGEDLPALSLSHLKQPRCLTTENTSVLKLKSKKKKKKRVLSIMQRPLRDLRKPQNCLKVVLRLQVSAHQLQFQSFSHCQTVSSATAVVNLAALCACFPLRACIYRKLTRSHMQNHRFLKIVQSFNSASPTHLPITVPGNAQRSCQ